MTSEPTEIIRNAKSDRMHAVETMSRLDLFSVANKLPKRTTVSGTTLDRVRIMPK